MKIAAAGLFVFSVAAQPAVAQVREPERLRWEAFGAFGGSFLGAGFMCGIQVRRPATTTEIENQAYYIGAYGLKEGTVSLLKSPEFYSRSAQPW